MTVAVTVILSGLDGDGLETVSTGLGIRNVGAGRPNLSRKQTLPDIIPRLIQPIQ